MEFLVLGPLEALCGERSVALGSAKQRKLLAALLVHANAVVSVDGLADILWGEAPPADAVATLQTYVSRLRAALAPGRSSGDEASPLLTRAPGYLLRVEPGQVDASRFERLLTEGRQQAAAGDAEAALRCFDDALGLWRGSAFAEFADDDFARTESLRLEELRRVATDECVDAKLHLGRHAELVGELEGVIAADPLRERPRGQLMLALYRSGREAEALRAYHAYRDHLGTELGVEPSNELQGLERDILQRSEHLAWAAAPQPDRRGKEHGGAVPHAEVDHAADEASASLPSGTVTFLFTDLEGSSRLWEEHPEAMTAALARHDHVLREAIHAHHGQVVKTTGDGAYAVFVEAKDAVAGGADALRAFAAESWETTEPLRSRMAVHTGSAELRGGDYYGPVLNRASRLMAAAHGDQFVLSEASAEFVRADLPEGVELLDLGEHRLRGLTHPERVYQVTIAGHRSLFPPLQSLDAFPASVSLPPPSFARDEGGFAGRDAELARLADTWKRATEGTLRMALVAGEPGMGKTRLVGELASLVYAQDGAVLYGRCDEDAVVPYQPFVEALRPYVTAFPSPALHERLHGLEQDLTRLFPELLGRILEPPPSTVSDPEAERYRLFEAVTSLLTGVAAAGPALLVLDDLHWADRPTLLLLRHVVRSAADAGLFVVVCYRDLELPEGHALADLLTHLRREPFTVQVSLKGLSEEEAGTLLRGVAGHEVAATLTRALHREAGGNPFFLAELLRSLMETNAALVSDREHAGEVDLGALGLPQSVRDLVARRVRRLPGPVNDVLSLASVVGPEFRASLLARAGEWPAPEVLQALDQAKDAGLVDEQPGGRGSYSFSHALIRQALYAELGTAQKAQMHARVGRALEQEAGFEHRAAVLAEHFTQALALGEAPKALEYATAAGRDAAAHLAFEDAAAYFEQALGLLDEHSPEETAQRVELLIDLAEALVFVDEKAGVNAALRAVDAARAQGSPEQFGRAVAVFAEPVSAVFSYPDQVATLLDEAQRVLGDEHRALRARLMAIEAFKYSAYQLQGRDGRALAEQAVHLARETADAPALTAALFARAIGLESTAHTAERLALGEELVALGRAAGRNAAMATAMGLRVHAGVHLELGDAESLSMTITELARTGEELRWLPALVYAAQWGATRALLEGRFDDVRACWKDMRRYARAYRAVGGMEAQQAFYLAREQGDLADLVGPLEGIAAETSESSESLYVPAMLAVAQLDTADETSALHTLDSLTAEDLHRCENESGWGAVLALLAEVAANGESKSHAALLCDFLEPFAGRLVATVIGLACLGAADRFQGMLSTTLGRWDDAEAHFERALDLEQRIRGRALLPRTRYWQARFLRARSGPGDDQTARGILTGVVQDTRELGMRRLCEQAEHLLAR